MMTLVLFAATIGVGIGFVVVRRKRKGQAAGAN